MIRNVWCKITTYTFVTMKYYKNVSAYTCKDKTSACNKRYNHDMKCYPY